MITPGVIESVSEVALWAEDVEAATAFYVENLGFTVIEADPGHNAFLKSGDFLLVLFNPNAPNTQLANDYLQRTGGPAGGVYHIAFRVLPERLDHLAAALRESGVPIRERVSFASGRNSYFLEDLDGHYIELTDR